MLHELNMKNYIIFEDETIQFTPGLNVITGETGSGKSLIIDAIEILCGGRFTKECIKSNADKSTIEGVFQLDKDNKELDRLLDEYGINQEADGTLLVHREVYNHGRSYCRVNGQTVTQTMLRSIMDKIIDIVAQHEHQLLFKTPLHIKLVDEFRGEETASFKSEIKNIVKQIEEKTSELESLYGTSQERERTLDLLRYQINEIEEAQLKDGELESLKTKRTILMNAEKLYNTISSVHESLYVGINGQINAMDIINNCLADIESVQEFDPALEQYKSHIANSLYILEDLRHPLRQYRDGIEFNSEEINIIEERLSLIDNLLKKYGNSIKEILEYKDKAYFEYNRLKDNEKTIENLEKEINNLKEIYMKNARKLSELRIEVSRLIEKKVEKELQDLNMMGARFLIKNIIKKDLISREGIDNIEFMLSANPGESERPLSKVASGGEVSRIMLAIKTVLLDADNYDCIVFDEIDAGIGGATANKVAEKLSFIAKGRQTICITHLAQIAVLANNHHSIVKTIEDGMTFSQIIKLNKNQRIKEIAKMIGGGKDQRLSQELAEKLLRNQNNKN